jgi:hypothetical protein
MGTTIGAGAVAVLGGLGVLGAAPVPATAAWDDVVVVEDVTAVNPCTGLETTIHLTADGLHLTGGASGNEGYHWRGTYLADDGSFGTFRDTDQYDEVSGGDGFVVGQRVVYSGTYEGRHQRSTFVAHATVTNGVERVFFVQVSASCSPG